MFGIVTYASICRRTSKPGLNRDLRLGREKWILAAAPSQRDGRIDDDLRIRRGRNVRIAGDIDRSGGPPSSSFPRGRVCSRTRSPSRPKCAAILTKISQ